MRILEVVSARSINGVSKHVIDLSIGLRKRGHCVTVLGMPGSWMLENARNLGFETVVSDMQRLPDHELRRVASIIHEKKIDVVHTHMSKANFFGVLLRWYAGVPSVASAHSCHLQPHWFANNFVIAVSEATRRYHRLVNLVPSRRIKTIHNSIQIPPALSDYQRAEIRESVRCELGLQANDFVVGLVGRVSVQKGQLEMIEAMPSLLRSIPNAKLLLIGGLEDAEYFQRVQKRMEALNVTDKVHVMGLRQDVLRLLSGLDVLAQPSLWESFPISMLEGMATGVPVVATDVGGVRECIEHNRSGLLVPAKKAAELSEAILKLANNPDLCRRLVSEAKKVVQVQFAPDSQTQKIEQVFESVCKSRVQQTAAA